MAAHERDPFTEPGLRDELITEGLAQLLPGEARALRHAVSPAETVERVARHLRHVARRLRKVEQQSEVDEAVSRINAAIDALGGMTDDFAIDRIAAPAELLTGILAEQVGAERPALPPAPSIPLALSELLVNGDDQPRLGKLLIEEINCAVDANVLCAFVGWTGVMPLRDSLRALVERGGIVRIVTSTYLGATSRKALDELVKLGAQVKIRYDGESTKLHAKSWLFHRPGGLDTAYVGSSNLSQAALHDGLEWNVRLARADAPGVFDRMQSTFNAYWNDAAYESYDPERDGDRLDAELRRAKGVDRSRHTAREAKEIDSLREQLAEAYASLEVVARPHQQRILEALDLRRERFDAHRNLVVSATGTGKTVIAALDYRRLCERLPVGAPRPRLLFLAHRERILEQARATFRHVLADPAFGEILGGSRGGDVSGRHVFAMISTLSRADRVAAMQQDGYDVVYVDEVHHAAAPTWRRLIEHLNPEELVGLTATPERADGNDITALFGGTTAAELRLWDAIDDQLLVPFQYYGVDDGTDLSTLEWHRGEYAIGALEHVYTSDHGRVTRTLEAINRWVEDPATMRALGFCVTKKHAQFMAEQFTKFGLASDFIVGDHHQSHRNAVIKRLERGELQCVFNVDVLGEGVDIPDVDTLLLLRPTQSPVVFAQQLGRGLRHAGGKAACTVIDLIGQHRREFRWDVRLRALIDPARGPVKEQAERGFPFLPAGCDIDLDEVSSERVMSSLAAIANDRNVTALRRDMREFRPQSLREFLDRTGRPLDQLYAGQPNRTWTGLRREAGFPTVGASSAEEDRVLGRLGGLRHVTDALRVNRWRAWLSQPEPPVLGDSSVGEQRLATQLFVQLGTTWPSLDEAWRWLWDLPAVRDELVQLLELLGERADAMTHPLLDLPDVPLQVHARYTRQEVLAALGRTTIAKQLTQREGVYFDEASSTQLMFVTLHKDERFYAPSVQYHDYAMSPELFHWESPNNWRQTNPATLRCIGEGPSASQHRLLFVRERSAGTGPRTRFRCIGQVDSQGSLQGERPVAITWRARHAMPEIVFEAARTVATG